MAGGRWTPSRPSRCPLRAAVFIATTVAVAAVAAAAVAPPAVKPVTAASAITVATTDTNGAPVRAVERNTAVEAVEPTAWAPPVGRFAVVPMSASTCRCKPVTHGICVAPLPGLPGSCTYSVCESLVCDPAGTDTCVRRVRMAYFLTEPARVRRAETAESQGRGDSSVAATPDGGGSRSLGGASSESSVAVAGGSPTQEVWACARMPVAVMEPAWACGTDPPLTCALRSDSAAVGAGARGIAGVDTIAAVGVSGWVTFKTDPDCIVRVDGEVQGLRPGGAYTLTMTRSGQLSAADAPLGDTRPRGGGQSAGAIGGGGQPPLVADAYDPLGDGRGIEWTLVAGGGGVATLSTMEKGLAVGEVAGRGLRLDLVGGGPTETAIARCVVGYAEQSP
ncbi:hypothetical protein MMPV_001583 [Pyropia vietnamensis]